MRISLDDIYYFSEVAKRGNFSATSQALNIPTTTLSRRITELEKALGYALFHRTTRKVVLTALGKRYFDECAGQMEGLLNANERVRTYLQSPDGKLRVSLLPGLAPMMPAVAADLTRRFPRLSFEFDLSTAAMEPEIGGMDIYVRGGAPDNSSLIQKPLLALRRVLVASQAYLRTKGVPSAPEDLVHHHHIAAQTDEATWELHREGDRRVVQLAPRFVSNSAMLGLQLASQGLGITQAPVQLLGNALTDLDLVRVLPGWELPRAMLYALFESRVMSARATAFIEVFKEHLHAHVRSVDPL